ncbi:MAG: hypothetical protein AB8G05_27720 [Oligoflexales bacterium]
MATTDGAGVIHATITKLENAFQKPIKDWLSPEKSQSENTHQLINKLSRKKNLFWGAAQEIVDFSR